MMAEENALGSDGDSSPDLGEMWKYGCPKSPVWSDDGLEEERGEDASSVEYHDTMSTTSPWKSLGLRAALWLW